MMFHEKLQRLRKANGLSQEQLAEKLDVSRQAVSKWETGTVPDRNNLLKISRFFHCSPVSYTHLTLPTILLV